MNNQNRRRQLLAAMLASPALAVLPDVAFAQALSVTELADRMWLVRGAGANVVVAEGNTGVVVIDGGLREHAKALLAEINRLTGNKPVKVLFNTNWRPEHTGLNYLLGGTGTRIMAHENTRLWQTADFYVEWEDRAYEPMPTETQANETFYTNGSLHEDGLNIAFGNVPQAHTDGDIYLHFPDQDVLVVSDLVRDHLFPVMDYRTGGWIGGMRDASEKLASIAGERTRIIPAEGGVLGKQAVTEQHEMLALAYEVIGDAYRSGWSLEDLMASEPVSRIGEGWGEGDLFISQAYRGTWYHVPGRAVRNVI